MEKLKMNTPATFAALTPAAKVALINCGGSRQGTALPQGLTQAVVDELFSYGLITIRDNLTQRGGYVRDHAIDMALDSL